MKCEYCGAETNKITFWKVVMYAACVYAGLHLGFFIAGFLEAIL